MKDNDEQLLRSLGARLREARLEQGMSQEDLSVSSGVARDYISKVESGHRNPSFLTLAALSRALKVPVGEMVNISIPAK